RVEHDFYYIDNWSLFFDLKILLLTIFSPKTYRNAY
ncbi:MAG: sugar transferase, partial [Xanthobacteraceae bacterium]|nr:sugar transferase [Xanthobacteraceae bacterium]